jgi:cation transport regulator ChaC
LTFCKKWITLNTLPNGSFSGFAVTFAKSPFRRHPDNASRLRALDDSPELNAQVRLLMNLFQEIGVAYEQGIVHRRETRDYFDMLVLHYWEHLRFVVERARVHQGYGIYRRFERFATLLSEKRQTDHTVVTYVFAYGSLLNPTSAARTLGRPVTLNDYVPAKLVGWSRNWALLDRVRLTDDSREVDALFLDLIADASTDCVGALLRVTPEELTALAQRERNYSKVDVSSEIEVVHGRRFVEGGRRHTRVVTFVSRPEHRAGAAQGHVLANYVALLDAAAGAQGRWLHDEFSRARPPAVARVEGGYQFV